MYYGSGKQVSTDNSREFVRFVREVLQVRDRFLGLKLRLLTVMALLSIAQQRTVGSHGFVPQVCIAVLVEEIHRLALPQHCTTLGLHHLRGL